MLMIKNSTSNCFKVLSISYLRSKLHKLEFFSKIGSFIHYVERDSYFELFLPQEYFSHPSHNLFMIPFRIFVLPRLIEQDQNMFTTYTEIIVCVTSCIKFSTSWPRFVISLCHEFSALHNHKKQLTTTNVLHRFFNFVKDKCNYKCKKLKYLRRWKTWTSIFHINFSEFILNATFNPFRFSNSRQECSQSFKLT